MKAFFKTADRLFSVVTDCPFVEDDALIVMRPTNIRSEYRRYDRTAESYLGLPVFQEHTEIVQSFAQERKGEK